MTTDEIMLLANEYRIGSYAAECRLRNALDKLTQERDAARAQALADRQFQHRAVIAEAEVARLIGVLDSAKQVNDGLLDKITDIQSLLRAMP